MTPGAPRLVLAAERRRQALELRREGHTYKEIGERVGFSLTAARKAVHQGLDALNLESAELVAELRAIENARLDHFLRIIWPKIEEGNLGAIDRGLRIMERRAKLFGLDMPTRIAPVSPDGATEFGVRGLAALLAGMACHES